MKEIFPQKFPYSSKDSSFEIKQAISNYAKYWPLFFLSTLLGMIVGFLYLRYSTPTYQVYSKILIKNDNGSLGTSTNILDEIDFMSTKNNVDGENEILKTGYLLRKVVDELNLNIQYFRQGNFKQSELYKTAPFKIAVVSVRDSIGTKEFKFKFLSKSRFSVNGDNINKIVDFNDTIKTAEITFVVQPKASKYPYSGDYIVTVENPEVLANKYVYSSFVTVVNKTANLIQMQVLETVPGRGEDVLNKLYEVYTRVNQENKNTMVDTSINFIDDRIRAVSEELSGVEKNIEHFKQNNELPGNVQDQAKLALDNSNEVQKQLVQQDVQMLVIESLENYINNNAGRIIPAASSINDPAYLETVQKHNNWVLERDRQLSTTKPDNPIIKNLDRQIVALKSDLLTSLKNAKANLVIGKNQLSKRFSGFTSDIKAAPSKERAFTDISRQQNLKQELYLYLLQKREEIAISKTGTLTNSRLIEPARTNPVPVTPKPVLVYLFAIGAGLILPAVFIFFRSFFNNKVRDLNDITSVADIPILGEIGHRNSKDLIVFRKNLRSASAEQFRTLRTNLELTFPGKAHQVIMVTSSIVGDGKTSVSVNMASSLALSGKKVVLVEFDLRSPSIPKELYPQNDVGISSFLNGNAAVEDLVQQSTIHPNLFVISSGTIPDNPGELLIQNRVSRLFNYLRSEFEYIVLDTPPVSIISDALLLGKYSDVTVYVVRRNFSFKQHTHLINDLFQNNKVPNLSIVMNDSDINSNYGYKKGYKNNYIDDKEPKFFKRKQKI